MGTELEKRKRYRKHKKTRVRERTIYLCIRLNEKESEKLRQDLVKTGKTKSEYIRDLIMDLQLKEKPDKEFYLIMKKLIGIGTNLNQIAKTANSLHFINVEEYKNETKKLNDIMTDLRKNYL